MKRVLIVTYYWPPMGGSGVQRWLKFSKYLPEYGWQPVVYTPANPDITIRDESLLCDIDDRVEIISTSIFEPYSIYRKFMSIGSSSERSNSANESSKPSKGGSSVHIQKGKEAGILSKIANFIRANLFIPDPRASWVRPSVKYLKRYIKNHPVDLIISTGPPHSMHLIARKLSKHTSIPWIADFRDPWTEIFYFKHLKMLPFVKGIHKKLEKKVLVEADRVLVVSEQMKKDFTRILASGLKVDADKQKSKIKVITNGYDHEDFLKINKSLSDKFLLVHTGLMTRDGNPVNLWQSIAKLVTEVDGFKNDIKIRLIGETDSLILDKLEELNLLSYLEYVLYLPHTEIVKEQSRAQLLLLPLRDEPEAGAILTGKFFEYLASTRPILAIGPENGDLGEALRECKRGEIFEFSDTNRIDAYLRKTYNEFKSGTLFVEQGGKIEKYSRKELTHTLVDIMETI